jgi:hypothetical protein
MGEEAALRSLTVEFEPNAAEVALTKELFSRRLTTAGSIRLRPGEVEQLTSWARADRGMQACRKSMAQIGIDLS